MNHRQKRKMFKKRFGMNPEQAANIIIDVFKDIDFPYPPLMKVVEAVARVIDITVDFLNNDFPKILDEAIKDLKECAEEIE